MTEIDAPTPRYISAGPMTGVRRVRGPRGSSYIEPPLDPDWPDLEKLRWNAAVILHDFGLRLTVTHFLGSDTYGISGAGHSLGSQTYAHAWRTISDLGIGADMAGRQTT